MPLSQEQTDRYKQMKGTEFKTKGPEARRSMASCGAAVMQARGGSRQRVLREAGPGSLGSLVQGQSRDRVDRPNS